MTQTHIRTLIAAAAVAVAASGCTMKEQKEPPLAGPSGTALSLAVTANPDTVVQDGASQSVINIRALDADAQPIGGLTMRVEIVVGGVVANDFGMLSASTVSTSADGRAAVVYTAPLAPADPNDPGVVIDIWLTPIGTNYDNGISRRVSIWLVAPGMIHVPGAPFPEFTYSPLIPTVGNYVSFNASASSDPGGRIELYEWDYGDGDFETGVTNTHDFRAAGTYRVTLTVTDNSGQKASKTRSITVVP